MNAPARRASDTSHIPRGDKRREDVADAVHQITPDFTRVIVLNQPPQAAMLDGADVHVRRNVRYWRTEGKARFGADNANNCSDVPLAKRVSYEEPE